MPHYNRQPDLGRVTSADCPDQTPPPWMLKKTTRLALDTNRGWTNFTNALKSRRVFLLGGSDQGAHMKKFLVILSVLAVAVFMSGIASAQEKAPGTVILKGAPMGGVKFDHAKHSKLEGVKCDTCHHPSKPEKASKTAHENCMNCHTKAATAPMKTNTQGAFHKAMAKGGLCIDCHAKAVAAGKTAPTKCAECHKKENV
jgi:hypothetical protein